MIKSIYVVSTYYHALISCTKQLLSRKNADILCTDYIPCGRALADKIRESGLFDRAFFIGSIKEYRPHNLVDYALCYHKKNAELIEKQLTFSFYDYGEINVFHDDIWAAHYLKDRRIRYRLIEDGLDSFKIISGTKFSYMLPKKGIKTNIKKLFGIGYLFCGLDPVTCEVEVNDINGVEISGFASDKLVEVPRKTMFGSLTKTDIEVLKKIFMKDTPQFDAGRSAILLTQPLFVDGLVSSAEEQIDLYKKLVKENVSDECLVIKPHPRDTVDYLPIFPQAVIVDKNMPIEMLELTGMTGFAKALAVNSTSLRSISASSYIEIL